MVTDTEMLTPKSAPKCLKAFYGARKASRSSAPTEIFTADQKRRNTAKSMIAPGDRPQEIYTPPVILEAVLKVWPRIALDPCSGPGSLIYADTHYYVSPSIVLTKSGKPKTVYTVNPGEIDGLTQKWVDYTYVNPPFNLLKAWLMKARHEGQDEIELMFLSPARGHRKWYRDVLHTCTSVCDLDPVKFVGFKSAFPTPLVMLYWGQNPNLFANAFEQLGDVR